MASGAALHNKEEREEHQNDDNVGKAPTKSKDVSKQHSKHKTKNKRAVDTKDASSSRPTHQENCDKNEEKEDSGGAKQGKEVADPLRVDLYERLRAEKDADGSGSERRQWDNYEVCKDLTTACKKFHCSERQFYAILMSIFAAMTFAMVLGLFILQAQISMSSQDMLSKVGGGRKEIPQGVYSLYFDYLGGGFLPDKVDLRANTTIFVH